MPTLGEVLELALDELIGRRALVPDPEFGIERGTMRDKILRAAVADQGLAPQEPLSPAQEASVRASIVEQSDALATLWQLASTTCIGVLDVLFVDHGLTLSKPARRGVRESLAGALAHAYQSGGLAEVHRADATIRAGLVFRGRLAAVEKLSPKKFAECCAAAYDDAWSTHEPERLAVPSPELLELGHRDQPPLYDRSRAAAQDGMDRDVYSRHETYYSLRSRSVELQEIASLDDPDSYYGWLRTHTAQEVALIEVARTCRPYGLEDRSHHHVLEMTYQVFQRAGDERAADKQSWLSFRSSDEYVSHEPEQLVSALRHLLLIRTDRDTAPSWLRRVEEPEVVRAIMRRMWVALHRNEVETRRTATRRWYARQFESALKYAVPTARVRPPAPVSLLRPGIPVTTSVQKAPLMLVFHLLSTVPPQIFQRWLTDISAGLPEWRSDYEATRAAVAGSLGVQRDTIPDSDFAVAMVLGPLTS